MKQLVALITQAIAILAGYRSTIKALTEENQKLREELAGQGPAIEELKAKLAAEELDDAALEAARSAAEARAQSAEERFATIKADADEVEALIPQFTEALNDNSQTPNVNPDSLEVVPGNPGGEGSASR